MTQSTLRTLDLDEALTRVEQGALWIDLRTLPAYLEVHVPTSLALGYEFGPGMAGRARDCLPLSAPLVLMRSANANMLHAAASLRGKGFNVLGEVDDAVNGWARTVERGKLVSTDLKEGPVPPAQPVLDVGDAGRRRFAEAVSIPIEELWERVDELKGESHTTVLCGHGVRAALAIGMLERIDVDARMWRNVDQPEKASR
jgi:rhodanese-related sulfurtransferase